MDPVLGVPETEDKRECVKIARQDAAPIDYSVEFRLKAFDYQYNRMVKREKNF
jgi:hypothetical protein